MPKENEEKIVQIIVSINSYEVNNSFTQTQKILDTPSDTEIGIYLNKLLHDYKSDFILIRRIAKK